MEELARIRARCRRRFKEEHGMEMPDFESEIGADIKAIEQWLRKRRHCG